MFIVIACMALLLSALERIPQIRFRPAALFRRYFISDIFYLVTGFIAGGSAAVAYFLAVSGWLGRTLSVPRLSSAELPTWVIVTLALVLLDLGNYIAHYLLHRLDVLWEFHKVHHSVTALDWLVTFRSHIFEQFVRRLIAPASLILIGFPLSPVLIASAAITACGMLNHSNLGVNLRFLESILITPRLHRLHHVYKTSEKNLGTVFTIWDQLRGTLVREEPGAGSIMGNGDTNYPQGWLRQLIAPLRNLANR